MCSRDDGESAPAVRGHRKISDNKCVKCDAQGIVVTRIHDSFCKDCFRVYIVHKFRSAIGKSKLIRDGEKVLVAFSGGASSSALLHLISDGLSVRAHKKLRFIPTLLHIDEYSLLEGTEKGRKEYQQEVSELMLKSGFQAYITSLEEGLHLSENSSLNSRMTKPLVWNFSVDAECFQEPTKEDTKHLLEVFESLSSLTCKEDFLRNLRNQLIVSVAQKLGFDKVFTAECSSRLSVRILADIAQGRGSQVYLDTGFSDSRNRDVMFIRPIRDLTSKEVAMYNSMFEVSSVFQPTLTTKASSGASIERLTESFVAGLQADFPSTTSNIVRTSEKLSQSSEESSVQCSFCKSCLDTNVGAASALNAILFSKALSTSGSSSMAKESVVSGFDASGSSANNDMLKRSDRTMMNEVIPQLCFGCRLSVQNFSGDLEKLPFVKSQIQIENDAEPLRSQIAEFLLDNVDDE